MAAFSTSMQADSVQSAESRATSAAWPRALVLALAVGLCYANSLDVPFLLDDPRPGVALDYTARPLVWATFDLNRALGGDSVRGFHVFNALVHLACGLLLFGVLRRSMAHAAPRLAERARTALAFVTSLLWLVHPLQTASITYLSQRAEAMASFFYLGVLYAFLRASAAARPATWQALALLSLALGFATKEIVATAPLLVWLFDALFLSGGPLAALRRRRGFYAALVLGTLALAALFVVPVLLGERATSGPMRWRSTVSKDVGALAYARTEAGVVLHYLRLVFWPHPLCFDYGWPIAEAPRDWLPQCAAIAALFAATLVLCLRRSGVGFALASFFLVLAPTSSFVPVQDRAFEHRMYLPLAAVLVLAVAGGARIGPGRARTLAPALAGVAALALAALTVRRNHDYRSAVDLMRVTVATAPHHARARIGLGAALLAAGRPQEAVAALDEALRLEPENAFAHMNLGVAYAALEELDRAIPHLEAAVEHLEDPRFLEELGRALFLKGEHAASVPYFERALELDPGNAFLHCRLAYALGESRRTEEALRHYGESLRLEPELQEAHFQIAALLVELGRPAEAVEHGLRALEIAPNTSDEVVALGRAFRAAGRLDDALTAFRMAASLDPARPEPCAAFAETVCAQPGAGLELRREAVRMARAANELTGWKRADLLELCALAEAGAGACAEAARLVEQALELAGPSDDPDLAQRLRSQREDYLRRAGEER